MPRRSNQVPMESRIAAARAELATAPWEPDRWSSALGKIVDVAGGWCGNVICLAPDLSYDFHITSRIPQELVEAWLGAGGTDAMLNPRAGTLYRSPSMTVVTDDDVLDARARALHPFYQDVYRPFDVDHAVMATLALPNGGLLTLDAMRPESAGATTADERAALCALLPELAMAIRLQSRLEDSASVLAAGVLDQLRLPAYFLDSQGGLTGQTKAGEAVLREASILRLRGARLEAVAASDEVRLRAAIDRVRADRTTAIEVLLGGSGHPIRAHVAPAPYTRFGSTRIVITLPTAAGEVSAMLTALGLTRSEAAVAVALSDGERPADIAAERRVSITTIRGQVREIYSKLDVSGVAQLTAKLRALR